ncbi:MAG: NUDIX hydrolase [Microbacteriaceae bacterium]|nr:NUDIX hydrolase [Burkholderiaceae bacterium]
MSETRWKPSVTVAAIVERDGRYLLVEELTPEGLKLNNPAGHLDPGESPEQGAARECLEETACTFVPQALVGVYLARFERPARAAALGDAATGSPAEDITYLRFAYCGTVGEPEPGRALDTPIVRTWWLTPDEVRAQAHRLRSPLVQRCIDDHQAGVRHPLGAVWADESLQQPLRLG